MIHEPETAEFYYRYDVWTTNFEEGVTEVGIRLRIFTVRKRTRKGAWVQESRWDEPGHFVLDRATKRWAYPTLELARDSFTIRKYRQRGHLQHGLRVCEKAIDLAERGVFPGPGEQAVAETIRAPESRLFLD